MIKINKIILIAACFGMISSCTILPRSGPNKYEVTASARGENPTAHIVPVTPEVVYETKMSTSSTFTKSFLQAKPLNAELIRPGDTLNLTVWENVEDGLLSSGMASAATLSELQVDGSGHIFVPYAGRIKVAGQTPEDKRPSSTFSQTVRFKVSPGRINSAFSGLVCKKLLVKPDYVGTFVS